MAGMVNQGNYASSRLSEYDVKGECSRREEGAQLKSLGLVKNSGCDPLGVWLPIMRPPRFFLDYLPGTALEGRTLTVNAAKPRELCRVEVTEAALGSFETSVFHLKR